MKPFSALLKISRPVITSFVCVVLVLCVISSTAAAQSAGTVSISKPDTSAYPVTTFYFWPMSSDGTLLADLTTADVHVLENDREVKITSLDLLEPGTHVVVAVNEGKTLSNSYAGTSRFDRMKVALIQWIQSESITTLDDFSLVNNTDVVQNQLSHPAEWIQAVNNYTPDLRSATPSLNSLAQALSLIKELPSTDSKARAILYITPLPDSSTLTALQEQGTIASEENARLFIWLVGPQDYSNEEGARVLQQLAQDTGGSFFIYSGAEDLPQLNSYLNPLSHEYKVTYQTPIQKSGSFTLKVQVSRNDFDVTSPEVSFDLTAQAPNPILISPPAEITLNWSKSSDKKTWVLSPNQYTVNYMVEFPDSHTRTITAARLFVDGKLETELTSAPLDKLTWNLSQYNESASHKIQVFIEDSAGFTSSTIETPVQITINPKPQTSLQKFFSSINYVTVGIIVFILLLAAILFLYFYKHLLKLPKFLIKADAQELDPVKQAVVIEQTENTSAPSTTSPADWPRLPNLGKAPARLLATHRGSSNRNIGLSTQDVFLGNDALRNDVVLSDPTVASVHAKIFTDAAKHFYIADCGTTAGTWVNYAPVSQQGTRLQHGDLVNIGAVTFRFEEVNPEGRPIQVFPND